MKNIKFLLLPFLTLFFSCEPDAAIQEAQVQNLEIISIEVPEEGGVKLKAKYTGAESINNLSSGFLISRTEDPNSSEYIDIEGTNIGDEVKAETVTNLIYNTQYYVRAYLKQSSTGILYSDPKSFVSLGSRLPEVYEMEKGLLQDTVKISGKYFTDQVHYISVFFDGLRASVISSNDSIINCIVPANIEKHDPLVEVKVFNKTATYDDFSLLAPAITGLSEDRARLGDTITLQGENFDFEKNRNTVYVDQIETVIISSSREAITFVIPGSLNVSTNQIKLLSQLQETTFSGSLKIDKPVIQALPGNFRAYETIEILGEGFSTVKDDNRIYFEDNLAEVLEASTKKLTVRVPIGTYRNRNPEVKIGLMDYIVRYEGEVQLNDVWLLKNRLDANIDTRGAHYFVHNNLGYTFEREDDNTRFKVHVLNPVTETWSNFYLTYPRTEIQREHIAIGYNEESGRIFFYFSAEDENFYELDLQSKTFSLKKDYPGIARGLPAVFSIDNKIYMGLGRLMTNPGYGDQQPLSYFWSYNIDTDRWNPIADFPLQGARSDISVFVLGDNAYLGNGASHTGNNDFWRYSPASDKWERMADFPGARTYTSFFEYDGKAYVYFGVPLTGNPDNTAFRYDPALDKWMLLDPVNDLYYTYFIYPDVSIALRFQNAIYLGILSWPHNEFFKADLSRLKL